MNITLVALFAYKLFDPDEPRQFGGAELQLLLLSKEIVRRHGVRVQLITRGRGPYRYFEQDGIHVYKLPYYQSRWKRSFWGIFDILRALFSLKTDIYVQRGRGLETGLTAFVARWKKTPFLFMSAHMWDIDGSMSKAEGFIVSRTYLYGLKRASMITTQSNEQKALLKQRHQRDSVVIQSAHQIPETIPEDKSGVLWIGRCEPWKNPELFLSLAEKIPDHLFTMVCPKTTFEEKFERLVTWADKLSNVDFLPGVTFDESEKLFEHHQLFVNTSLQEGFPNTFVQALKWGTPVISLNVNPDGFLHTNEMGVCTQGDFEKMVESVQDLLSDAVKWSEYSRNARHYAIQNHDLTTISETFYKIIQDVTLGVKGSIELD